jgi:hypothetical protein
MFVYIYYLYLYIYVYISLCSVLFFCHVGRYLGGGLLIPMSNAKYTATYGYLVPRRIFIQMAGKSGCSTGTSREVTHPSTIPAQRRLTSEF